MITSLLAGNQHFLQTDFQQHEEYYRQIAQNQTPSILWIGCSDSRVSEDVITHSKPGTIFAHRNIANIVSFSDMNFAAILEYAVVNLKIPDVIICGHTNCGGMRAIAEGKCEGYIADWLQIAQRIRDKADASASSGHLTEDEKLTFMSEQNVLLQIEHLKRLSLIRRLREKGTAPRIHGWLYSVETGQIKVLVDGSHPAGPA